MIVILLFIFVPLFKNLKTYQTMNRLSTIENRILSTIKEKKQTLALLAKVQSILRIDHLSQTSTIEEVTN
jgi:transcriptional regulator